MLHHGLAINHASLQMTPLPKMCRFLSKPLSGCLDNSKALIWTDPYQMMTLDYITEHIHYPDLVGAVLTFLRQDAHLLNIQDTQGLAQEHHRQDSRRLEIGRASCRERV